jgi:hypothetical protein
MLALEPGDQLRSVHRPIAPREQRHELVDVRVAVQHLLAQPDEETSSSWWSSWHRRMSSTVTLISVSIASMVVRTP